MDTVGDRGSGEACSSDDMLLRRFLVVIWWEEGVVTEEEGEMEEARRTGAGRLVSLALALALVGEDQVGGGVMGLLLLLAATGRRVMSFSHTCW